MLYYNISNEEEMYFVTEKNRFQDVFPFFSSLQAKRVESGQILTRDVNKWSNGLQINTTAPKLSSHKDGKCLR